MGNTIECPNCEEEVLLNQDLQEENGMIYQDWECEQCGTYGKDWYSLEFETREIEGEK